MLTPMDNVDDDTDDKQTYLIFLLANINRLMDSVGRMFKNKINLKKK